MDNDQYAKLEGLLTRASAGDQEALELLSEDMIDGWREAGRERARQAREKAEVEKVERDKLARVRGASRISLALSGG
jgi:hypothetical protein